MGSIMGSPLPFYIWYDSMGQMGFPEIVSVSQIILSIILIVAILLQQKGSGLSTGIMGAGGGSFHTKRGLEKSLYVTTIIIAILFATSAITVLVIK